MKKKILSLVIVAVLLAAFALIWQVGGNSATNSKSDTSMDKTMTSENPDSSQMMDDASMDKTDSMVMMEHPGKYVDYSDTVVTSEHAAGNKVVLFFHAPWCPFCREADAAFKSNSSKIPSSVTVVKTDYDSSVELKKKYAVTTQHTFVQVDSSGNLITKWVGGDIANLQKYIK